MTEKKPKISIVTINYNNLEGLCRTLESVRFQTYVNYELIIIDGGSTDGSLSCLKSNQDLIRKFISEKDAGIYNAQNKGVALAKGEYLVFLNAGDAFLEKNVLFEISKFLEQDVDLVYGDILIYLEDGEIVERKYPDKLNYFYWSVKSLCHQAAFIRKDLFDLYGCYNEEYSFAADFEFFHRFWFKKNIKIKHASVFVTLYDLNGVSAQPKNRKRIEDEYRKIKREYFPMWAYIVYRVSSYLLESTMIWDLAFKIYRFFNPKK